MLTQVLERFSVERVILVADRGLLSLDNISELTELLRTDLFKGIVPELFDVGQMRLSRAASWRYAP